MSRTRASAHWERPAGRGDPIRLAKSYTIVPRGIGLVIGVSTFPTWNGYPAIFADLATGNPVIVKPHPAAILPLALTVRIARAALADAGFDPNLVLLAADDAAAPIAQDLALRPGGAGHPRDCASGLCGGDSPDAAGRARRSGARGGVHGRDIRAGDVSRRDRDHRGGAR